MFAKDLITEEQDLRYLTWSKYRKSSGTAGSFLKAYGTDGEHRIYYKLSNYDTKNGITGHECVNELIVDRLLTLLGIEHLHYQLIKALVSVDGKEHHTWICASQDFKSKGDSKIPLDTFYDLKKNEGEEVMDFCVRMGWSDYIYTMLAVDYVILNRDRHGANIEILKNQSSGIVRPAPLFDHGLSLIFSCRNEDDVKRFDPAAEKSVQSFIGGSSTASNLKLIPEGKKPKLRRLNERDIAVLREGLEEALPQPYLDKIIEMVQKRLELYESI